MCDMNDLVVSDRQDDLWARDGDSWLCITDGHTGRIDYRTLVDYWGPLSTVVRSDGSLPAWDRVRDLERQLAAGQETGWRRRADEHWQAFLQADVGRDEAEERAEKAERERDTLKVDLDTEKGANRTGARQFVDYLRGCGFSNDADQPLWNWAESVVRQLQGQLALGRAEKAQTQNDDALEKVGQHKRQVAVLAARTWWQELQHDAGAIPAVGAVLNLHWPEDGWMSCRECEGFDADWPCPTVYAISEYLGSGPVPDGIEHVCRQDLQGVAR